MNYLISFHAKYVADSKEVYGPVQSITKYLKANNIEFVEFKHCLDFINSSKIYQNSVLCEEYKISGGNMFKKIHSQLSESIRFLKNKGVKYDIFIGVNLINSFLGVILKRKGIIKKNIYFNVDYTEKRYSSAILNKIYMVVDKICEKNADEIWCVSSRIVNKRISNGVKKEKIFLIPNSPNYNDVPKFDKNFESSDLIIVSNLTNKGFDLESLLQALLKLENYGINLKIIGDGEERGYYENMVNKFGLQDRVKFMGIMNNDEVLSEVSKSFAGIALYNGLNTWNIYGDSMKAREYCAAGVPVIINDLPSTADDIKKYNAGVVLEKDFVSGIVDYISSLKNNKGDYEKIRENALRLAKDFDKTEILKILIQR